MYGPTDENLKEDFLLELAGAAPPMGEPWLLNGDFNMIYQARDKSNSNINRRVMGRFRRAVDYGGLKEIKCKTRTFTWSNEREDPTFCSIDKFFCNTEWETMHQTFMISAASTFFSDHYPLILRCCRACPHCKVQIRKLLAKISAFQRNCLKSLAAPGATRLPFRHHQEENRKNGR